MDEREIPHQDQGETEEDFERRMLANGFRKDPRSGIWNDFWGGRRSVPIFPFRPFRALVRRR